MLVQLPPDARYVLVAAQQESGLLALAAWGTPQEVFAVTHHKTDFEGGKTVSENLVSGTYWYLWPDHAFGFSSDPALHLWYADVADQPRFGGSAECTKPEDRLSWNLETVSTGGFRAGRCCDLGENSGAWTKCLYYLR